MNYELLLNKEDGRTYGLLKFLQDRPGMSATMTELQHELNLSSFLLDKTLTTLKEDIQRFKMSAHFQLIVSDTSVLLETDSHYSRKLLQWKYLSESLSLEMLIAIFREKYISTEQFAESHHVSYSVAYKTLQVLKKALKPYQIMINKGKFVGNELHIFLFLTEVFPLSTISETHIYSVVTRMRMEKIVDFVCEKYDCTKYEQNFLRHYVSIMIEKDIDLVHLLSKDCHQFIQKSEDIVRDDANLIRDKNLRVGLFIWLCKNGKGVFNSTDQTKKEDSIVSLLNDFFCDSLVAHFDKGKVTINPALISELTRVHFSICYFPSCLFKELEIAIDYFAQNYPEYYEFLANYIRQLHRIYPIVEKFKSYLFFQYLLLLINYVPIENIEEPVRIMLDFSWGEQYNSFIKKNLSFFVNLNIEVIETEDSSHADIVLTNINRLYKNNESKILVWLDPPQTNDWLNLTNVILDVKKTNL